MPILISLETSDNENVAERALDLHRTLHQKHSSLVNVRFLDFAKNSYEYQRTFTSEVVGEYSCCSGERTSSMVIDRTSRWCGFAVAVVLAHRRETCLAT
jgi:hypothetical protein